MLQARTSRRRTRRLGHSQRRVGTDAEVPWMRGGICCPSDRSRHFDFRRVGDSPIANHSLHGITGILGVQTPAPGRPDDVSNSRKNGAIMKRGSGVLGRG